MRVFRTHARTHTADLFEAAVGGSVLRLRYFCWTSLRQKRRQKRPGVRERGMWLRGVELANLLPGNSRTGLEPEPIAVQV